MDGVQAGGGVGCRERLITPHRPCKCSVGSLPAQARQPLLPQPMWGSTLPAQQCGSGHRERVGLGAEWGSRGVLAQHLHAPCHSRHCCHLLPLLGVPEAAVTPPLILMQMCFLGTKPRAFQMAQDADGLQGQCPALLDCICNLSWAPTASGDSG